MINKCFFAKTKTKHPSPENLRFNENKKMYYILDTASKNCMKKYELEIRKHIAEFYFDGLQILK